MPTRPSKNVVQKLLELPPDLVAEVDTFRQVRGQHFREVVIDALRRHLAYPPPPPAPPPPLAPLPDAAPPAKRPRGRPRKTG